MTNFRLEDARVAIRGIAPDLEYGFMTIAGFLLDNPQLAPAGRGIGQKIGDPTYFDWAAARFTKGRRLRAPEAPATVPDPIVSLVLNEYFGVGEESLVNAAKEHSLSMGSENIVGDLLERYIASEIQDLDWVWCSGESVKHVDFVRNSNPGSPTPMWESLQVKNRDNSENSSSSAIRNGTSILKWYRTKSRTGQTMWHNFPLNGREVQLDEASFQTFVITHLRKVKASVVRDLDY